MENQNDTQLDEQGNSINPLLPAVPSWEEYQKQNSPRPYQQEEKFGDYDQRMSNHINNLYAEWLKLSGHSR